VGPGRGGVKSRFARCRSCEGTVLYSMEYNVVGVDGREDGGREDHARRLESDTWTTLNRTTLNMSHNMTDNMSHNMSMAHQDCDTDSCTGLYMRFILHLASSTLDHISVPRRTFIWWRQ
jgi:hypothetical protein